MQKKLILIIFVVILVFSISCNKSPYEVTENTEIPQYSGIFDEAFMEEFNSNYSIVDPQLAYYLATPWEACLDYGSYEIRFAQIENNENNMYISVTNVQYIYTMGGGFVGSINVYQHKNAPRPMKDWTIEKISFIALDNSQLNYAYYENEHDPQLTKTPSDSNICPITAQMLSQQYMTLFDIPNYRICSYNNKNNLEFVSSISESYNNKQPEVNMYPLKSSTSDVDNISSGSESLSYYMLVQFEENENIIWYAQLYNNLNNELYFCVNKENNEYAKISDQYAKMLLSLMYPE